MRRLDRAEKEDNRVKAEIEKIEVQAEWRKVKKMVEEQADDERKREGADRLVAGREGHERKGDVAAVAEDRIRRKGGAESGEAVHGGLR